jgi:hypothetical protein
MMIKMINGEYGHCGYGDGGVVMLGSIVVLMRKGGTGTGVWPSFWGYPWPLLTVDKCQF